MAFYTARYIRQLAKEDHVNIQKLLSRKDSDFRQYIDSILPFSLLIDIDSIMKNVVNEGSDFVKLAAIKCAVDTDFIIKELLYTYKQVINDYIDLYPTISSDELENKLADFQDAVYSNTAILPVLAKEFKRTFTISNVDKRNKTVLIISPSFKTIQSNFSKVFKRHFRYSRFSDQKMSSGVSPREVITSLLNNQFGLLQNLGHIEVDIISSSDNEIKRGLVTPKLLNAILDLPADVNPQTLAKRFSKETGQASTRVIVRKKFASSRLVLEMLVETGFLFGTIESRKQNLQKSSLESSFAFGKGLSERIRKDSSFLVNLETSKSINQYISGAILDSLRGSPVKTYSSISSILSSTAITRTKVTLLPRQKTTNFTIPTIKNSRAIPLLGFDLLTVLQAKINQQVRQNMGTGRETRILNYRTGRLAESVEVERLSTSRDGMITVFYNYMRNPYGTFSSGGRQQYPTSRDPKLLISKSIREIASAIVTNKLRSVLV